MFAGEAKQVIWRTVRRAVRELFMNNVRQIKQKTGFSEQFGELFASCS
jgi:hypothetical protein